MASGRSVVPAKIRYVPTSFSNHFLGHTMSSLLTNTSSMTALQVLSQTQQSLQKTQSEISTGQRISSAADGASYWSIATKMKSTVGALGAVSDALAGSAQLVSTMNNGVINSVSVLQVIQRDLVQASNPGADKQKIQDDIGTQQKLLISIGQSSTFNGINLLAASAASTQSFVASYDSTNGVSSLNIDTSNTLLFTTDANGVYAATSSGAVGILDKAGANYTGGSVLNFDISSATAGDIANILKDVGSAIDKVTAAGSYLGATTNNINVQANFISNLSDSLTSGVGALVDANMNEASTKLAALQVQQQLGIQALSIANSNTQLILRLFQ
ncbi:flagellin domain protein [Beijerinckia indica subsp. indica ATCC 9039]|uniref:Flagellin n=2 Tax=Beijerinckia TaxID=532 RepID=B2IJE9_BEII9|nr:flagellin domain protein [Beijerinckia indica subsp. indica ATCC 9039]